MLKKTMKDVTLEINFNTSPQGNISRKCRKCGGDFQIPEPKIMPEKGFCPYCGFEEAFDQFMTPDQERLVQSLIFGQYEKQMKGFMDDKMAQIAGLNIQNMENPRHDYQEKDQGEKSHCYHCHQDYNSTEAAKFCPHCGKLADSPNPLH